MLGTLIARNRARQQQEPSDDAGNDFSPASSAESPSPARRAAPIHPSGSEATVESKPSPPRLLVPCWDLKTMESLVGSVEENFEVVWIGSFQSKRVSDPPLVARVYLDKAIEKDSNSYCSLLEVQFDNQTRPNISAIELPRLGESYKRANIEYAKVVFENYREGDIIWCEGFHLLHLPEFLKGMKSDMKVVWFLNGTFSSSKLEGDDLPPISELLRSVLAADVICFPTYQDLRHFVTDIRSRKELDNYSHGDGVTRICAVKETENVRDPSWVEFVLSELYDCLHEQEMQSDGPLPLPMEDALARFEESKLRLIILGVDSTLTEGSKSNGVESSSSPVIKVLDDLCSDSRNRVVILTGYEKSFIEDDCFDPWFVLDSGMFWRDGTEHVIYSTMPEYNDREWIKSISGSLNLIHGSRRVEVRPVGVTKGGRMAVILDQFKERAEIEDPIDFVLCMGHFPTMDEDLYEVFDAEERPELVEELEDSNFFSVAVSKQHSSAKYLLEEPNDMMELLRKLAAVSQEYPIL